jgi:hypothetical protein
MLNDRNRSPVFKARETTLNSKHVRTKNFSFGRMGGGVKGGGEELIPRLYVIVV